MRQIITLQLGPDRPQAAREPQGAVLLQRRPGGHIAGRCKEVESGRPQRRPHPDAHALPEISQEFLTRMAAGQAIARVYVGVDGQGGIRYEIT
jgi:type VI secretion system protein VasG